VLASVKALRIAPENGVKAAELGDFSFLFATLGDVARNPVHANDSAAWIGGGVVTAMYPPGLSATRSRSMIGFENPAVCRLIPRCQHPRFVIGVDEIPQTVVVALS
jgi:hypothetical protein